jgi:hypothetical protein
MSGSSRIAFAGRHRICPHLPVARPETSTSETARQATSLVVPTPPRLEELEAQHPVEAVRQAQVDNATGADIGDPYLDFMGSLHGGRVPEM